MDSRVKVSKNCFFSCHKRKLAFNVTLEADDRNAIFYFCGPGNEVEAKFFHMLKAVKGVAYYQVDGSFSEKYKGGSLYRIGIDINSQALTDMFWFLSKAWKAYDEKTLLAKIDLESDIGKLVDTAVKAAESKRAEPLPDYTPNQGIEPPHKLKSFGKR